MTLLGKIARQAGIQRVRHGSSRAEDVLGRLLQISGPVTTVIDVGASDGRWSVAVRRNLLPEAQFVLFEANPVHASALQQLEANAFHVEFAAASDRAGTVHFYMDDANPLGGGASDVAFSDHDQSVAAQAIDTVVKEQRCLGPYLLKLDTQGHEEPILRGASNVLGHAALVQIETYGVDEPGRMAFDEMVHVMRAYGFRPAGIADVMFRPSDGVLWQMDTFFLPESHAAFQDTTYH